jgi:hypothetical protein
MKYSDDFQPVVFENFKKELDNIEIDLSNARIRFTRNLQYQFGKIIPDLFNEYENDVKKIETNYKILLDKVEKIEPIIIYGLYDPRTWELKYVGQTKKIKHRLWNHGSSSRTGIDGNKGKDDWFTELSTLGLSPIISPLEYVEECDANSKEIFWISKCASTNLTNIKLNH